MEIIIKIINWIFSANSAGILTLVAGFIAWVVYKRQVKLREKEAATVLINEIRHAEKALNIITRNGFDVQNETISILPTCSWDKNYQIFTRYLNRDEFELLSDFFNSCKAAQSELEQWRHYFFVAREQKGRAIQTKLVDLADECNDEKEYKKRSDRLKKKTLTEDFIFRFGKPEKYFSKYVRDIPRISGTTIFEKLSQLAEKT